MVRDFDGVIATSFSSTLLLLLLLVSSTLVRLSRFTMCVCVDKRVGRVWIFEVNFEGAMCVVYTHTYTHAYTHIPL